MALTQETVVDKIEVLEDSTIQARRVRRVFDGSDLIGERYHRSVYTPDTDPATIVEPRVRAVATVLWTPTVVQAYLVKRAALSPKPV